MLVAARKLNKHDPNIPAGASPSRLGLVVTKKVGNAVARARLKRVCRECFRLWPGFVPEGIDLVVIAKIGADELGLAAVRTEWQRARGKLLERCRSVLSSVHDAGHEKAGASEFAASPFAPNPESKRGAPL